MCKNIYRKLLLLIVGLSLLGSFGLVSKPASAVSPTTINFQGKVVNATDSTNVNSGTNNYTFVFRLYNVSSPTIGASCTSGSGCLWEETDTVSVTNGVFQAELGNNCSFFTSNACNNSTPIDFSSNSIYLTMKFNSDSAGFMTPLIHFTGVPYAYYASNSAALGGIAASGFIQNQTTSLQQANIRIQSAASGSIAAQISGASGQSVDIFDIFANGVGTALLGVSSNGLISLQPAASLTAGQTAMTQTLTNASSTGGTVNGYSQNITVNNTSSGSTTNGFNISLTDNASSLTNTDIGLKISLSGSNASQSQIGIDVSTTNGVAVHAVTTGTGSTNSCGGLATAWALAVCGDANSGTTATGVYGRSASSRSTLQGSTNVGGEGVVGKNSKNISSGYGIGVEGITSGTGTGGTSIGVYGESNAGAGATTYGGYFALNSASSAILGAALYATNSTIAANILDLQDNTTSVFTVADGGLITLQPAASLTNGQTEVTQTFTAANATANGVISGYSQNITVSNTTAGTTSGFNISLTDNTALGNINNGVNISLSGSNTSQAQVGVKSTVSNGIGIVGRANGGSSSGSSCGNYSFSYGVGVCGIAYQSGTTNTSGTGVVGISNGGSTSINSGNVTGVGVSGRTGAAGTAGEVYTGVQGLSNQSTAAAYSSIGSYGYANGGAGATVYGGYFTLGTSGAVLGSALYASNSTVAANILNLQDNTTSVFTVGDGGLITLQPAASLTNGQTEVTQTFTAANATANGVISGYSQNITVSNTTAGTTSGFNISLTDNTALGNTNKGIVISLSGSNASQKQIGIDISVNRGVALNAVSTGASSVTCGSTGTTWSLGVCGNSSASGVSSTGVYGRSNSSGSSLGSSSGVGDEGIFGINTSNTTSGNYAVGVKGITSGSGTAGTAIGSYGEGNAGAGATAYGGYFSLGTNGATLGSALYATNSTVAANILDLQDNTTSVFTVGDGGSTTLKVLNSTAQAFQVQNSSGNNILSVSTSANGITLGESGALDGNVRFRNATNNNSILISSGATSASYNLTLPTAGPGTSQCLQTDPSTATQLVFGACSAGSGATSVAYSTTPNANGGSISGSVLTLTKADGTNPGLLSADAQTIGGDKTFNGKLLQNSMSLVAGDTAFTQGTITNASSTGGTVNGYSQTISVSNIISASTTNGFNISLTDNTALANTNKGLKIALAGTNSSQQQIGIDISVTKGVGLKAVSSGSAGSAVTCATVTYAQLGICADGGAGPGIYADSSGAGNATAGIIGNNSAAGVASNTYAGIRAFSTQTNNAGYTSIGVYGQSNGGVGATTYGGYFTLNGSSATAGAALYATNSTVAANILDLQDNTTSVFTVGDGGLITMQPAASLTSGQTALAQTLTNASSTGGTVNGYNQTITVSNTTSASTTNGINISLADNATALANTDTGLKIALTGSNTSKTQYGADISVAKGVGLNVVSNAAAGSASVSCGSNSGGLNIGACITAKDTQGATGVFGVANVTGGIVGSNFYGLKGEASISGLANYTAYGVYGITSSGSNGNVYGGYFKLSSNASATGGGALYATNGTDALNILQLQDNTTDVFVVGDGGSVSVTPSDATKTITLGSTAQTGTITLGQSTDSNTISIGSSNSLASGKAQTINIGTSTGAGSTTNINIGSSVAGTVTVNSGLTLASGKTLTVNGDAITDLTGNGLAVSSNALTIALQAATATGASATTSSGSGLEVLSGGLTLLQGCSDGQILKWTEATGVWACSADNGGAGSTPTLTQVYGYGASQTDETVTYDSTRNSIIFRNPAASGSGSGYALLLDQLATGTQDGLQVSLAADSAIGSSTRNGLKLSTGAITETAASTGTFNGISLLSPGAISTTTAAGTLNWNAANLTVANATANFAGSTITANGLKVTTGNLTQTAGTLIENGVLVDAGSSAFTTGGTLNGVNVNVGAIATGGVFRGLNISTNGTSRTWNNAITVTGINLDLNSNITADVTSLTGMVISTVGAPSSIGGGTKTGLSITSGAIQEAGNSTGTYVGEDITIPSLTTASTSSARLNAYGLRINTGNLTQTLGTLTQNGLYVDSGSTTFTTGGNLNGINVNVGAVAAGNYNGINISTNGAARTFGSSANVTGLNLDLNSNVTATGASLVGLSISVAGDSAMASATKTGLAISNGSITQTSANTGTFYGIRFISPGGINTTTAAGTLNWNAAAFVVGDATANFAGSTINANGLKVTTGNLSTFAGTITENGIYVDSGSTTASGGGNLNGININVGAISSGLIYQGINISTNGSSRTIAQGTSTTGLNIDLNTNVTANGTPVTGISVSTPADTGIQAYTKTGIALSTGAITQATADIGNYNGISLLTPGAISTTTAAGTLNWNAANFRIPNATSSFSGSSISANGLSIVTGGTVQGAGTTLTENGIYVDSSSIAPTSGTLNGLNLSNVTDPGAGLNSNAITIGTGWDKQVNGNGWSVDGSGNLTAASCSGCGGVSSVSYSTTANANGGSVSGGILTLAKANGSNPGLLSADAQTIGGDKTLQGATSFAPTANNVGTTIKQTSGTATSGNVFDVQTANGTSHFIQIANSAANEGTVLIQSIGATRDLTIDSGSGIIKLGGNSTSLQKSAASFTLDIANAGASTLNISNSNGSNVANLSVSGDITAGSGHVFKVGSTSGTTLAACGANNYVSSFASSGGIVTGGSCSTISSSTLSDGGNLAKLNTANTFVSNSASGIQVQDSSNSKNVMTVDTSGDQVILGMQGASGLNGKIQFNTTNAGNTYVALAVASTASSYTITLPTAVSAGAAYCLTSNTSGTTSWTACGAGATATVTLTPEYAGAVLTPANDGFTHTGTMTSDYCGNSGGATVVEVNTSVCPSGQYHNYYSWTGNATNYYDIFVVWTAPTDFSSLNSVTFNGWTSSTTDAASLRIYKNATTCGSTGTVATTSTWGTANPGFGSCTIAAGDKITFDVTLKVGVSNEFARAGEISIVYNRN